MKSTLILTFTMTATLFSGSKVKPSLEVVTAKPDAISGESITFMLTKDSAAHWVTIACSDHKLIVQLGEPTFGASLARSITKSRLEVIQEDATGNPAIKYGVDVRRFDDGSYRGSIRMRFADDTFNTYEGQFVEDAKSFRWRFQQAHSDEIVSKLGEGKLLLVEVPYTTRKNDLRKYKFIGFDALMPKLEAGGCKVPVVAPVQPKQ